MWNSIVSVLDHCLFIYFTDRFTVILLLGFIIVIILTAVFLDFVQFFCLSLTCLLVLLRIVWRPSYWERRILFLSATCIVLQLVCF